MRKFSVPRNSAASTGGVWLVAGPQLVVQKVTEAETTAWARHHEALKTAPNPLLYCFENLP